MAVASRPLYTHKQVGKIVYRRMFTEWRSRDPPSVSVLSFVCLSAFASQVVEFLSRNFEEPRWRAAAEKNAYRLVQQRRYHLAAAFFILAKKFRVSRERVLYVSKEDGNDRLAAPLYCCLLLCIQILRRQETLGRGVGIRRPPVS